MPNGSAAVLAALKTRSVSGAALLMRTTTLVAAPVQPARIDWGSIGSENVKAIVSASSALPTVVAAFAACASEAVGTVLSTVTEKPASVRLLPATSVEVSVNGLLPAASGLSATRAALR